jgi:hypothetical protein
VGDGATATEVGDAFAARPVTENPRAIANATDALTAITSTTSDANIGVVSVRPERTTAVGVSVTTAAPRR